MTSTVTSVTHKYHATTKHTQGCFTAVLRQQATDLSQGPVTIHLSHDTAWKLDLYKKLSPYRAVNKLQRPTH